MTEPSSGSSGRSGAEIEPGDLSLKATYENGAETEVYLQHGLTIGRGDANSIPIDDPSVERIHGQICRRLDGSYSLECNSATIAGEQGAVASLALGPGVRFRIASVAFLCQARARKEKPQRANAGEAACLRCHAGIEPPPNGKRQIVDCPGCGLQVLFCELATAAASRWSGWVPRNIGPYVVRDMAGVGGMGVVLRATHEKTYAMAAVKVLRGDSAIDKDRLARFEAEIESLRSIRHPNIVRLRESGRDGEMAWLAMDWVVGQPLSRWIAKARQESRQIPLPRIAEIIGQTAAGLAHLAEKGLVHRDLKPANLLIGEDYLVRISDLGLAKSFNALQDAPLTVTGVVAGTEGYMAPEQMDGRPITAAADVFSLGVVFYELLTLKRPVGMLRSPRESRTDCPVEWDSLVSACLDHDPVRRPTPESLLGSLPALAGATRRQGAFSARRWQDSEDGDVASRPRGELFFATVLTLAIVVASVAYWRSVISTMNDKPDPEWVKTIYERAWVCLKGTLGGLLALVLARRGIWPLFLPAVTVMVALLAWIGQFLFPLAFAAVLVRAFYVIPVIGLVHHARLPRAMVWLKPTTIIIIGAMAVMRALEQWTPWHDAGPLAEGLYETAIPACIAVAAWHWPSARSRRT